MSSLLGGQSPVQKIINYNSVRTIYDNFSVLLVDTVSILSGGVVNVPIPVPLLTFTYRPIGEIQFLKYKWSEYPYLSRQILTNSNIKEGVRFSVELKDPMNFLNPIWLAVLKRQGLIKLLETYCDKGGRFVVLTLWGTLTDCVLEGFSGIEDGGQQGVNYRMDFYKPNFNTSALDKALSTAMSALANGGI